MYYFTSFLTVFFNVQTSIHTLGSHLCSYVLLTFLFFVAMAASFVVASCSNDNTVNEVQDASQGITTRTVGTKTPKFTAYIETNDINPLNAGEYYFTGTNPHEEVIDHVILFASNIRGTASSVQLYHNPNQTYILH